jgi:hypothetical protein
MITYLIKGECATLVMFPPVRRSAILRPEPERWGSRHDIDADETRLRVGHGAECAA